MCKRVQLCVSVCGCVLSDPLCSHARWQQHGIYAPSRLPQHGMCILWFAWHCKCMCMCVCNHVFLCVQSHACCGLCVCARVCVRNFF